MKKCLIIFALTLVVLQAGAREVYNINRDWHFFIGSDAETSVNLPHIWNNDALAGQNNYYRGMGSYQKDITIPEEWQDKRIFIKGYGANQVANVMVNGRLAGEHRGGYTAFVYELTDLLQYGRRNFFSVSVNNSPRLDVLPISGDANVYGGIFRDLELIVTGKELIAPNYFASEGVCVVQKKVTQQKVEAEAVVKVSSSADKNLVAQLEVADHAGNIVATAQQKIKAGPKAIASVNISFSITNPTLWNGTYDPYMYVVMVTLLDGERTADSVAVATGFRSLGSDASGSILLNGKPYPIRGVTVHQDRAGAGPALRRYEVEEDFDFVREMGANLVRVAGVAHHPYFYELCDRHGILVWSDFPIVGPAKRTDRSYVDTPEFRTNAEQQAREIIYQQFNHPSVAMWGLFSDIRFRGDDAQRFIENLNKLAKTADPSRLTVAMSNDDGDINLIPDVIAWDHHFGWKEGNPADISVWQKQFHDNWSELRSAVSYSGGASIHHQSDSLYRPDYMGSWHPERWQTHLHEEYYRLLKPDNLFWGTIVGNLFDYGAAVRSWGEGTGINDCGLVTFDRKYRKDAFYLYKANWNTSDPFVYIAERRWDVRKQRKQDILVFTNQPDAVLFVNNVAHGTSNATNGTIRWKDVELKEGVNNIEVRSGDTISDGIRIEIRNSDSKHVIQ